MYVESEDFQSVWQLAHRWAGQNPSKTDIDKLPETVKLNLKRLSSAIMARSLPARTKNFAIFIDDSIFDYLFNGKHFYRLLKCKSGKVINKNYLESLYIKRSNFLEWCEKEKYPNSDFWILTQVTESHIASNRPKNEIEDKAICRAIAKVYWDIDSNIHPAHMADSKAIKKYGNGDHYEISTIKGWISDLDPLIKERNTGRPKEITYKIKLETGALLGQNEK